MADFLTDFHGLKFSGVKHHRTKKVLKKGDIKEAEGYCGVVHVHNIHWSKDSYGKVMVASADVDLYCTPFEETNVLSRETGSTDHRVQ